LGGSGGKGGTKVRAREVGEGEGNVSDLTSITNGGPSF